MIIYLWDSKGEEWKIQQSLVLTKAALSKRHKFGALEDFNNSGDITLSWPMPTNPMKENGRLKMKM